MAREVVNLKAFFFRTKALLTKIGSRFSLPKPSKFNASRAKLQSLSALLDQTTSPEQQEVLDQVLLFHLEEVVLKSFSIFSYFMLVSFEAGGLLRAVVLFLIYPFVRLAGEELGLKIIVFVAFFGLRKRSFRVGRAVLPKFLLEDSASQGVEAVMRFKKKVCVTNLPRVMVESFAVDYLGADAILGRELKVVCGYFVGLMEGDREQVGDMVMNGLFGVEKADNSRLIGIVGSRKSLDQKLLSHCKVVYQVSENEKKTWKGLPRAKYPKPLVFHDGRLAFKPTFIPFLELLVWLPFGFFLFFIRLIVALSFPHKISVPILSFTGIMGTKHKPKEPTKPPELTPTTKTKGTLYVCNHRTLIDPITLSMAIGKPVVAVTYSLSRVSEILSPIRTVRLTRDRIKDSETMEKLLSRSDLVVCPEGTTCREPYLLRFSPLFAELTDDVVPVAVDFRLGMFYGTTAGGYKFLDPVFLLLNPRTDCTVKLLEKLPPEFTCGAGGKSKFEVANYVQSKIAEALGFECTNLTRKDKYIILAGNEGRV